MLNKGYRHHNDRDEMPFWSEAPKLRGPEQKHIALEVEDKRRPLQLHYSDENNGISLEKRMAPLECRMGIIARHFDDHMYEILPEEGSKGKKKRWSFEGGPINFVVRHFADFPVCAPLDRDEAYSKESLGGIIGPGRRALAIGTNYGHHLFVHFLRKLTKWEKVYVMLGEYADQIRGHNSLKTLIHLDNLPDLVRAYTVQGARMLRSIYDEKGVTRRIPHEAEFLVPFVAQGYAALERMQPTEPAQKPVHVQRFQPELGI